MNRLLSRVVETLKQGEVAFAVIGASAMAAYGVSRSTFDIDLLTIDEKVLNRQRWKGLRDEGIGVILRIGDVQDPLRGVVRFEVEGQRPVDLIVGLGGWQTAIFERVQCVSVGGIELPLVAKVDLVLLKLYAGGPQDLWDIQQLLSANESENLRARVSEALAALPAQLGRAWAKLTPPDE